MDWIKELEQIAEDRFKQSEVARREFRAAISPCVLYRLDLHSGQHCLASATMDSIMPGYSNYYSRPGDSYTVEAVFTNQARITMVYDRILVRSLSGIEHTFFLDTNPIIIDPGQRIELYFKLEVM